MSLCSHSPVNSGEAKRSISIPSSNARSSKALPVGVRSLPSLTIYFSFSSFSMMDALVAGVPRPLSFIASASFSSSTSLSEFSIAESKVASLYFGGGVVSRLSFSTSLQSISVPGGIGVSVLSPFPSTSAPYITFQPGSLRIFPSVRKVSSLTNERRLVLRKIAGGKKTARKRCATS